MRRRLVIVGMAMMIICAGLNGCGLERKTHSSDRQEYAENAYELGLAESLAVMLMPSEESAKVQQIIHEAMSEELTIEEQEEILTMVFNMLNEYITTENLEINQI